MWVWTKGTAEDIKKILKKNEELTVMYVSSMGFGPEKSAFGHRQYFFALFHSFHQWTRGTYSDINSDTVKKVKVDGCSSYTHSGVSHQLAKRLLERAKARVSKIRIILCVILTAQVVSTAPIIPPDPSTTGLIAYDKYTTGKWNTGRSHCINPNFRY